MIRIPGSGFSTGQRHAKDTSHLVYVDRGRVLLWGNRTGSEWTEEPVTIMGTPDVVDADTVQLTHLHGSGMAGVLWSTVGSSGSKVRPLDLTGVHALVQVRSLVRSSVLSAVNCTL